MSDTKYEKALTRDQQAFLVDLATAIITAYGDLVLPSHTEQHLLECARKALAEVKP